MAEDGRNAGLDKPGVTQHRGGIGQNSRSNPPAVNENARIVTFNGALVSLDHYALTRNGAPSEGFGVRHG